MADEVGGVWPRPRSSTWARVGLWPPVKLGPRLGPPVGAVYEHRGRLGGRAVIRVISTRVLAQYPDSDGIGAQDHVSVSAGGRRVRPAELELALRAFGMLGTEEDNHHPGIARHFWRPVDPAHRVACSCKSDETSIVEPDGYEWQNTAGPGEVCRGCEYQRMTARPCPLHGGGR